MDCQSQCADLDFSFALVLVRDEGCQTDSQTEFVDAATDMDIDITKKDVGCQIGTQSKCIDAATETEGHPYNCEASTQSTLEDISSWILDKQQAYFSSCIEVNEMKKMKIVKQQQYYDSNEELMQIQKKKIALQIDIMQQYQSGEQQMQMTESGDPPETKTGRFRQDTPERVTVVATLPPQAPQTPHRTVHEQRMAATVRRDRLVVKADKQLLDRSKPNAVTRVKNLQLVNNKRISTATYFSIYEGNTLYAAKVCNISGNEISFHYMKHIKLNRYVEDARQTYVADISEIVQVLKSKAIKLSKSRTQFELEPQ